MIQRVRALVQILISNRALLFWIDGLGAIGTAAMMGLVLPRFHAWIGLPVRVLHLLAVVGSFYAAFSLLHAIGVLRQSPGRLKFIAAANAAYCVGTAALLAVYREQLGTWGAVYFAIEIAIILALVVIETRAARQPSATAR
jgi:hypothetical protein